MIFFSSKCYIIKSHYITGNTYFRNYLFGEPITCKVVSEDVLMLGTVGNQNINFAEILIYFLILPLGMTMCCIEMSG